MYEYQREQTLISEEKAEQNYRDFQSKVRDVVALQSRHDEAKRFVRQLKKEVLTSKQRSLELYNKYSYLERCGTVTDAVAMNASSKVEQQRADLPSTAGKNPNAGDEKDGGKPSGDACSLEQALRNKDDEIVSLRRLVAELEQRQTVLIDLQQRKEREMTAYVESVEESCERKYEKIMRRREKTFMAAYRDSEERVLALEEIIQAIEEREKKMKPNDAKKKDNSLNGSDDDKQATAQNETSDQGSADVLDDLSTPLSHEKAMSGDTSTAPQRGVPSLIEQPTLTGLLIEAYSRLSLHAEEIHTLNGRLREECERRHQCEDAMALLLQSRCQFERGGREREEGVRNGHPPPPRLYDDLVMAQTRADRCNNTIIELQQTIAKLTSR